jgi:hypothetical protein
MQDVVAHHRRRFRRMLTDMGIDPSSLISAAPGFAIRDDASGKRLTPPLHNQTMVEGLISAIKLAAWSLGDEQ